MKLPRLVAFPRPAMQEKSKLTLTVQYADPRLTTQVPRAAIRRWVQAALFFDAELTVRFVTEKEGRTLNRSSFSSSPSLTSRGSVLQVRSLLRKACLAIQFPFQQL